jgi:hypothetical protein
LGRRGVVWDREGEEGMRVIQRKGKGREEGKGREGKGREGKGREGKGREGKGRKEEEDDLAPQKKFLDPPLARGVYRRTWTQLNSSNLGRGK